MQSLALYIHWPYCLKKCPYCDFNSHVANDINYDQWIACYKKEIAYYQTLLGKRKIISIFFGGGTPSLMPPEMIEHILKAASQDWIIDEACEVTLEANPTSIEVQKFKDFKAAGINRVSVGVQSLRDEALHFLGREHSASEALKALEVANNVFERTSFDLIYARPHQACEAWQQELEEAMAYANGHMSLYQLTIESGTQFKIMHERGDLDELDHGVAADMYDMTMTMMAEANMPAYEISNFANKGQESRHNLTYWRYGDYVGIGPGAHGRITLPNGDKVATRTHKSPDKWMADIEGKGHGAKPFDVLSDQEQKEEKLMMGLRLGEGIDESLVPINHQTRRLFDHGFLKKDNGHVFVPQNHWIVLDSILAQLLVDKEGKGE